MSKIFDFFINGGEEIMKYILFIALVYIFVFTVVYIVKLIVKATERKK